MNTSSHHHCPQCSTPLPADAPGGLCPQCVMALNFGPETIFHEGGAEFSLPSIEELSAHFPQLEIIELLGRGGMGAVYKARQKQLDRIVALKILPPGIGKKPTFAERFTREARALAKLHHPNIVTLYEFGEAGGLFYFLMEFVDGLNLRQLLDARHLGQREALVIVPQICEALQFAHDQGIVHRDIKPENILLDRRGQVKVADFGLAKIMQAESEMPAEAQRPTESPELSMAGKVMGTPSYMAPEQTEHPDEVDHRADIYALGVVFYQMLTGELPIGRFAPPSRKVQIDVRLDEVVLRALEKDPELRYQQASVLKTRVETIASEAGSTPETRVDTHSSNTTSASQVIPLDLKKQRWEVVFCGFWLMVTFVGMGLYLKPLEHGWGVAIWGILLFLVPTSMALLAGNDPGKIKLASQLVLINGIVAASAIIWCTLHSSSLPISWRPVIILPCLGGSIFCLIRLVRWEKQGAQFPTSLGVISFFFALMSMLLPMLCYWLKPTASHLTQETQQFMLWLTLLSSLLAVSLGFIVRKSRTGFSSMILGGTSLSIWILFFLVGLLSPSSLVAQNSSRHLEITESPLKSTLTQAVQSWLSLMDSGNYAESWQQAAASFHDAVTQEKWVSMSAAIRKPLGRVLSRTSVSLQRIPPPEGFPAGDYTEAHYDTSFEKLAAAKETIKIMQEKNGVWRVIAYLILPDKKVVKGNKEPVSSAEKSAVTAAQSWLVGIDAGNYPQSWKEASTSFQAAITGEAWVAALTNIRKPLGAVLSRKLKSVSSTNSLPGAPDGNYVVMQFDTSYVGKTTAVATVTFQQEKDGSWKSCGYYIR